MILVNSRLLVVKFANIYCIISLILLNAMSVDLNEGVWAISISNCNNYIIHTAFKSKSVFKHPKIDLLTYTIPNNNDCHRGWGWVCGPLILFPTHTYTYIERFSCGVFYFYNFVNPPQNFVYIALYYTTYTCVCIHTHNRCHTSILIYKITNS